MSGRVPQQLFQVLRIAAGSLTVFFFVAWLSSYVKPLVTSLDVRSLDLLFYLRGVLPARSDVIVILEDDKSAKKLRIPGRSFRRLHAQLVNALVTAGGVRAIVFDHDFEGDMPEDRDFAGSLKAISKKVVVGSGTTSSILNSVSLRRGYLGDIIEGDDGVERFVIIAKKESRGICAPALALEAVGASFGLDTLRELECEGPEVIMGPSFRIPVERGNVMVINFLGPSGKIPLISYSDAVSPGSPSLKAALEQRQKVVVIGEASERFKKTDWHWTPVGEMSGAELHANIIDTILHQRFVHRLPQRKLAVAILMLCGAVCTVASCVGRVRWFLVASVGVIIASALAGGLFFTVGTWNPWIVYAATALMAIPLALLARLVRIIPGSHEVTSPYPEFMLEFWGGSFLGVASGHLPIWIALVLGGIIPFGLLALKGLGRGRAAASIAIAATSLLMSPSFGTAAELCGRFGGFVEYSDPAEGRMEAIKVEKTERVSVYREGKLLGATPGVEVMAGDEIRWGGGAGFAIKYVSGSTQIFARSGAPAVLRVDCNPQKAVFSWLSRFVGWIQSVVKEGTSFEISLDRRVTAGTAQTAFELGVDSATGVVVVRVWSGQLRVTHEQGVVLVDPFEDKRVTYTGAVRRHAMSLDELRAGKLSALERARLFGVYGDAEVERALRAIEHEIAQREVNPDRWTPRVGSYVVQPRDNMHNIILKTYDIREATKGKAIEMIEKGIIKTNPAIKDPDNIQAGKEIRLPVVPNPTGKEASPPR